MSYAPAELSFFHPAVVGVSEWPREVVLPESPVELPPDGRCSHPQLVYLEKEFAKLPLAETFVLSFPMARRATEDEPGVVNVNGLTLPHVSATMDTSGILLKKVYAELRDVAAHKMKVLLGAAGGGWSIS